MTGQTELPRSSLGACLCPLIPPRRPRHGDCRALCSELALSVVWQLCWTPPRPPSGQSCGLADSLRSAPIAFLPTVGHPSATPPKACRRFGQERMRRAPSGVRGLAEPPNQLASGSAFHCQQSGKTTALLFVVCFFSIHSIHRGPEPLLVSVHATHTQHMGLDAG